MEKDKSSDRNKAEDFIAQTLYGILPEDLWNDVKGSGKDPFESYSDEEKRVLKRKFRKIKRKLKIGKYYSSAAMWKKINLFLKKKESGV
jgi:hypothetical protein